MKGVFEFIINGELKTFNDYRDIPDDFDHVIKFIPDIPDGPHTEEEHQEMEKWNNRLQELMTKERKKNGY
jgi:hypothetical protein